MRARTFVAVAMAILFAGSVAFAQEGQNRIDINKATAADLMTVNGVGKGTADKILQARDAAGGFKTMNEVTQIKGIGKVAYAKLICVFYVPAEGVLKCEREDALKGGGVPGQLVNLNTGDVKELTKIPGIGKKKAETIIEYRKTNGWFKTVQDLGNIKGFGPKSIEKIADKATVKVEINAAITAQFEALGFTNAAAIIEFRTGKGGFKAVDELLQVPGIDNAVYEKAKDILCVKGAEGDKTAEPPTRDQ